MRLARLDLVRYGRFATSVLEFPAAERDLHIVFGPNEAGKTTARAAIADLLFGFEHSTAYDFRFEAPQLRVGALLQKGERRLVIRRRKGRTNTLLDDSDRPISDSDLVPFLEGRTRELFERLFSLDQDALVQGGQDLVQARNDLGRMLFQSAAGLGRLGEALERLEKEADLLWAPRRSDKRAYWQAETRLQEADRELRETTLRAPAYREAVQAHADALAAAAGNDEASEALRAEEHRLRRIQRALPPLAKRAELLARLAQMGTVVDLPQDAADRLAEVRRHKAAAEERIRLLEDSVASKQAERETLTVDDTLLAAAEDIERLKDLRARYRPYPADMARREGEVRSQRAHVARLVAELGWHTGSDADLADRLPGSLVTAGLRALAQDYGRIATAVTSARQALEAQRLANGDTAAELSALPEEAASQVLTTALNEARRLGDADERQAELRRAARTAADESRSAVEALRPWRGDAAELAAIVSPSSERMTKLKADLDAAEADGRRTSDLAASKALDLERARQRVRQIRRDGRPVSAEELRESRAGRDRVWYAMRDSLQAGDIAAAQAQVDPFEAGLGQADELADRRFERASESTDLTRSLQDVERLELEQAAAEASVRRQAETRAAAHDALRTVCEELGLPAAGLEEVESWLRKRAIALDKLRLHGNAARDLADFEAGIERSAGALRAALGEAAGAARSVGSATFGALLKLAADTLREQQMRGERRGLLQNQLQRGERHTAKLEGELAQALHDLEGWRAAWQEAGRTLGLGDSLTVEQATVALDLLQELKSTLGTIADIQSNRIDSMQRDLDAFATEVAPLAAALAPDLADSPAGEAVDRLAQRLGTTRQAAARRQTLDRELTDDRTRLRTAREGLASALAALGPLLEQAAVSDLDALHERIDRSQDRRRLLQDIEGVERSLLDSGDGLAVHQLQDEADRADRDRLAGRLVEIAEELRRLGAGRQDIGGREQAAQSLLRGMQGSDAASRAAEARQRALAEMGGAVQRWTRLTVGIGLLRAAIDKYRESKQAPLLTRAQALFATLTLGEFKALRIDHGRADQPVLLTVRRNDEEVPLEGLSTGTADQLFLALRVAALEEYLDSASPLPLVVDDLFVNFDDDRAAAGLQVLGELARRTQVLFFTHHAHLVALAERAVAGTRAVRLA